MVFCTYQKLEFWYVQIASLVFFLQVIERAETSGTEVLATEAPSWHHTAGNG